MTGNGGRGIDGALGAALAAGSTVQGVALKSSVGQLAEAGAEAVATLRSLLSDGTPPEVRLGAGRAILELAARLQEHEELSALRREHERLEARVRELAGLEGRVRHLERTTGPDALPF